MYRQAYILHNIFLKLEKIMTALTSKNNLLLIVNLLIPTYLICFNLSVKFKLFGTFSCIKFHPKNNFNIIITKVAVLILTK